ncbi:MAG: bifunctional riboflavin kinase/FAD synthetase [Ignavibacteriales bacterium]|nr:MAG: bifunctional riboflavin kinase/FAD synthetase [Ignavibacteriales bacterium]
MKIYEDLSRVTKDKKTVITLGTFDGIHCGHRKILETVKSKAVSINGRSFLITFNPHPRYVLSGNNRPGLLTTHREKIDLLKSSGIENILVINFTPEFSQLSPESFVKDFMVEGLGLSEIIIGTDHHFGKGRGGDIQTLKEMGNHYGFVVDSVEPLSIDGEIVSSTKIRKAISEGDILKANKFLGRKYSFSGRVVEGDKRGRKLGFPTANIKMESSEKLLPALGIYVVEFILSDIKYYGLLSVGKRPTFYASGETIPEVYVFDFDHEIYGSFVTVNLIERLRGEEKFSSAEELISQMNKDKENGLKILESLVN